MNAFRGSVAVIALRWIARLSSLASLGVLAAFAGAAESGAPTGRQWVAIAFFPIGVAAGMVIGWWRALAGGVLTVASLGAFYAWMSMPSGRFPTGPYFVLLAFPGFVFLACGVAERMSRRRAIGSVDG